MKKPTAIDRLRGAPLCTVGEFTTVYRQGSLISAVLLLILSFSMGFMRDVVGVGIAFGVAAFILLFASALAVRFTLPDGSEI